MGGLRSVRLLGLKVNETKTRFKMVSIERRFMFLTLFGSSNCFELEASEDCTAVSVLLHLDDVIV